MMVIERFYFSAGGYIKICLSAYYAIRQSTNLWRCTNLAIKFSKRVAANRPIKNARTKGFSRLLSLRLFEWDTILWKLFVIGGAAKRPQRSIRYNENETILFTVPGYLITISISFPSSVDAMSEIIALYLDCRFNVFFLESVNILK